MDKIRNVLLKIGRLVQNWVQRLVQNWVQRLVRESKF